MTGSTKTGVGNREDSETGSSGGNVSPGSREIGARAHLASVLLRRSMIGSPAKSMTLASLENLEMVNYIEMSHRIL